MKKDNQLSFCTYEASLKIKPDDPLKIIFDKINWDFVYDLTKPKYSDIGCQGYDPVSLFKAQLLIYLGEVKSDRHLVQSLKFNTRHCVLCGFNNFFKTPSNGTFSNFRQRLGDEIFYEILHNLIAQAACLGIIIGYDVSIDATHIPAFSSKTGKKICSCKTSKCKCPRDYSDKDAKWGRKSKNYLFFGYKAHLIIDTDSQLPLEIIVTPANVNDSLYASDLIDLAKQNHISLPMRNISMDKIYDCYENYRSCIEDFNLNPIIPLKSYINPLVDHDVSCNSEGNLFCKAGFSLVYWGYEKKRNRFKFRCPAAFGKVNCLFQKECSKSEYGRTFYLSPEHNYRFIGQLPRSSKLWKKLYNRRTATERVFSELKQQHNLSKPRVKGLRNLKIHCYLSCIAQIVKRIANSLTRTPAFNFS